MSNQKPPQESDSLLIWLMLFAIFAVSIPFILHFLGVPFHSVYFVP